MRLERLTALLIRATKSVLRTARRIIGVLVSADLALALISVVLVGLATVFVLGQLPDVTTIRSGAGLGFDVGVALGVAVGGLVGALAGVGLGLLVDFGASEPVMRRSAQLLARLLVRSGFFAVGLLAGYVLVTWTSMPLSQVPSLVLALGAGVFVGAAMGAYGALLPAILVGMLVALPFGLAMRRIAGSPPPSLKGAVFSEIRAALLKQWVGTSTGPKSARTARRLVLVDDRPWRRRILESDLEAAGYSVASDGMPPRGRPGSAQADILIIAVPATSDDPSGDPPWVRSATTVVALRPRADARVIYLATEPELRHEGHPISATVLLWTGDRKENLAAAIDGTLSRTPTPGPAARVDAAVRRAIRTTVLARAASRRQLRRAPPEVPPAERYHDGGGWQQAVDTMILVRADGVYATLHSITPRIHLAAALLRCDYPKRWTLTLVADRRIPARALHSLEPLLRRGESGELALEVVGWDGYSKVLAKGAYRLMDPRLGEFPDVSREVSVGCDLARDDRYEESLQWFDAGLAKNPRSSWAWYERGHVLRHSRDWGRALIAYLISAELGEEHGLEFAVECARELNIPLLPGQAGDRWTTDSPKPLARAQSTSA